MSLPRVLPLLELVAVVVEEEAVVAGFHNTRGPADFHSNFLEGFCVVLLQEDHNDQLLGAPA